MEHLTHLIGSLAEQEYLSLPGGSYTFQAQATDLAGNVESATATSSNSQSWPASGALTLPSPHAIITGVVNN